MIRQLFALEMDVPAGKLPGFYAQIIHKIGDQVQVYDRFDSTFILSSQDELEKLERILSQYNMTTDSSELYQLPTSLQVPLLDDYGLKSIEGNTYLFAHLVSLFRLEPPLPVDPRKNDDPSDAWAVIEQLQEHLIAKIPDPAGMIYVLDSTHQDLAEHIARKYNVPLQFIEQISQ
ncbi:hypothetical protein ACQCN2_08430 [Brevibacillus ginsengisoli]|uniref:hypothetical protein n=1 Tax=Brevibacillus ginsengisoli TaxID=363854 RepID=UPI003CE67AB0